MELIRDLRRNGALMVTKVVLLVLLALALYNFGTFTQSTALAVDTSLSEKADVDIYTLVDTFVGDAEGFENFRQSQARLTDLGEFVEGLDQLRGVQFISAFDQPLTVQDFRGDERFDVGYGTEYSVRGPYVDERGLTVRDVKSIQMNAATFAFSGLSVDRGSNLDWSAVDYREDRIPVLLGAGYAASYEIGDELQGSLIFRDATFVVQGFLRAGSSMYFRGDINHEVDDAIVVPYPESVSSLLRSDPDFFGRLAFQMLDSDLAVDRSIKFDGVVERLDALGAQTGFDAYSLTGVPTYLVQLSLVREIVRQNLGLLSGILTMLVVAVVTTICFLNRRIVARRRATVRALWTIGRSARSLETIAVRSIALEYIAILLLFGALCSMLPNKHGYPFLGTLFFVAICAVVDGCAMRFVVRADVRRPRTEL
jgi:hypothetical protein